MFCKKERLWLSGRASASHAKGLRFSPLPETLEDTANMRSPPQNDGLIQHKESNVFRWPFTTVKWSLLSPKGSAVCYLSFPSLLSCPYHHLRTLQKYHKALKKIPKSHLPMYVFHTLLCWCQSMLKCLQALPFQTVSIPSLHLQASYTPFRESIH